MGIQDFIKRNARAVLAGGLIATPAQGAAAQADDRILLADNGGQKDPNVATDATVPLLDAAAPQGDMKWLEQAADPGIMYERPLVTAPNRELVGDSQANAVHDYLQEHPEKNDLYRQTQREIDQYYHEHKVDRSGEMSEKLGMPFISPGQETGPAWIQPASRPEMAKPPASAHELSHQMVEEQQKEAKKFRDDHPAEAARNLSVVKGMQNLYYRTGANHGEPASHPATPKELLKTTPQPHHDSKPEPQEPQRMRDAVQEFSRYSSKLPVSAKEQLRAEVDLTIRNYTNLRNHGMVEGGPLEQRDANTFRDTLHTMIDHIGTPTPQQQMQRTLAGMNPQEAEAYKHHMQETLLEQRKKSDRAHGGPLTDKEKAEAKKAVAETMRTLEGEGQDPHEKIRETLEKADPAMYKYMESLIHKIEARQEEAGRETGVGKSGGRGR